MGGRPLDAKFPGMMPIEPDEEKGGTEPAEHATRLARAPLPMTTTAGDG